MFGDFAFGRERAPADVLAGHHLLEFGGFVVETVDADHGERLVLQFVHERPLVGPTGPSNHSILHPEIEQHDLAAVVAELEVDAFLILARHFRRGLADGQASNLVQFGSGLFAHRAGSTRP